MFIFGQKNRTNTVEPLILLGFSLLALLSHYHPAPEWARPCTGPGPAKASAALRRRD